MGEAKVAHFVSDHVVDTVDGRLDELRVEENATVGITAPPATPHLSQTDIWLWDVVPPDDFVTSLKSSREREPRVLSKPIENDPFHAAAITGVRHRHSLGSGLPALLT